MPTRAQMLAAAAALGAALLGLWLGTRTVTNPLPSRACVAFDGAKPGTLETTRFYGVRLSPKAQELLGFTPVKSWDYVAMEIQAVPGTEPTQAMLDRLNLNADIVDEVEDRPGGPLFPNCQIAAVRSDDAAYPAKCACSTGSNCQYDPVENPEIAGNWTTAPKGTTFAEGRWQGAGCKRKVCVELLGSKSMPPECE